MQPNQAVAKIQKVLSGGNSGEKLLELNDTKINVKLVPESSGQ